MPEDTIDAVCETIGRRDQADDEKRFAPEVEEIAWLHQNPVVEQPNDQIFFRFERRHVKHRAPPTLAAKQSAGAASIHGRLERLVIGQRPRRDLRPDSRARAQQRRRRHLDRRGHGQVRVADELEPVEGRGHQRVGTRHRYPSKLHLREPRGLRQPAERDPLYTDVADVVLDVDGLTPDEVVDGIMRAVS